MSNLWKKRQAGSISITANGKSYTYFSTGVDAESAAPKEAGCVELSDKPYYSTGISFIVPQVEDNVLYAGGTVEDNVLHSLLFYAEDNMLILI